MLLFQAVYNKAVTGSPLKMPYMAYQETPGRFPVFVWQDLEPIAEMPWQNIRDTVDFERSEYLRLTASFGRFLQYKCRDMAAALSYWTWYCGLVIPLAFGVLRARHIPMFQVGFGILSVSICAEATVVYLWPHYLGPVFGLLVTLSIAGLRQIRMTYGKEGVCFSRIFTALLVDLSLSVAIGRDLRNRRDPDQLWRERFTWQLAQIEGKHLVIVRFPVKQPWVSMRSWVANAADIDGSRIVWAQSMGDNKPLLEYFKDRQVWLLLLDTLNSALIPYPAKDLVP
jgi:hypothetical protein